MRTPSEKSIVDAIVRYLKSIGAWHIKTHGGSYGRSGVPDLIVCFQGQFFAFEVKKPKVGVVTRLQQLEIDRINRADGIALVVTSVEQVKERIEQWKSI